MMKLVSINVGAIREVPWKGTFVTTGIFKSPVAGPVRLRPLNLDGDGQADPRYHGGPDRAVYIYPAEHYDFWKTELNKADLPWGSFGENFTTLGLSEADVQIGDHIRVGSVVLMATQPRLPCYKLGIRFGDSEIIKRFMDTEACGIYTAVVKEGTVAAGDEIEIVSRTRNSMSIVELRRIYISPVPTSELRRVLSLAALSSDWRHQFEERLAGYEEPAPTKP